MSALEILHGELLEASHLSSTLSLLGWDQRTHMPAGSGAARANQIGYLSELYHNKIVSEKTKDALAELVDLESGELRTISLNSKDARLVKEIWKDYRREAALPSEVVVELSRQASVSQQVWEEAKSKNEFSLFVPHLEKMIVLQKRKAEFLPGNGSAYDKLMDQFEAGLETETMTALFDTIRKRLVPLIQSILEVKHRVNGSVLKKNFNMDAQWEFGIRMLKAVGFDFNTGRQDKSVHPFTTSTHPTDVRITTRLRENDLKSALLATLHECGHGLYEQGLPQEDFGTPLGQPISLGIHESQSRLWENLVGLSPEFWKFAYPKLKTQFPEQLKEVDRDQFYLAMNKVIPSMIRVEADEATYNLHILLRFEIEQQLINDNLSVKELPGLWNDKMENYLGIHPATDTEGVLQDVHWSGGAFGYFPTYTLGNLYSVQLFNQAKRDVSGLEEGFAHGNFQPLLDWLREKIHSKGRSLTAEELILNITGKPLSAEPFLDYLENKYRTIYRLG